MTTPITREELQQIAINVASTAPSLILERQPGDVVFVRFTPREQTIALVTPEEAAGRLAAIGASYDEALEALRRNPAEVNPGDARRFVWIAGDLNGLAHWSTAAFRAVIDGEPAQPVLH